MQCPQCQFDNPEDAIFCNGCGIRLEMVCANCDQTNPLSAKFCGHCGQNLFEMGEEASSDFEAMPPSEAKVSPAATEAASTPIASSPSSERATEGVRKHPDLLETTRFVGREREIEVLQRAMNKAGEGEGQVVLVGGEAGVGKSRLFQEFTGSNRIKGWRVIEGGSISHGKASAYQPVIDLLKFYFGIHEGDDHLRIRERLGARLLALDESLTDTISPILSLLEVSIEDKTWEDLAPPEKRKQTLDAIKRLLLREAENQPLIIIFEDLHRIDTETQALLNSLVESLPQARILLLVNHRPGYEHDWEEQTGFTPIHLGSLARDRAEEMLNALLGESADLSPLKDFLIQRTGGNPFFLEECLRTLIETEAVSGERGNHNLQKDVSEIEIPSTIHAVLTARIDRLPPEEKQLLQTASTIGTRLTYPLLSAIAGISKESLNQGLASLEAAEFLSEMPNGQERAIQFKHSITHEVAYGTLLQERRRTLHAVTVDTIERQAGDRLDEHVDRLAHHAFQGEVWDKATHYAQQAGFKAINRSAYSDATSNFERALEALAKLPETNETIEQSIDLRFPLRDALHALGELEGTIKHLREAEKLARKLDDPYRLGRINGYMALYYCRTGASDLAIESAQRALTLNLRFGDLSTEIVARYFLANAFIGKGEYARAREEFHRAIALLEGDLVYERFALSGLPSVLTRVWLVWCQVERGQFEEGMFWAKRALEIAEEADDSFSLAASHFGVGSVHFRRGEVAESIPILEQSLEICRTNNIRIWVPWVTSSLGLALVVSGRSSEGFPLLEYAIDQSRDMNLMCHVSLHLANLSQAHFLEGRIDEAFSHAERALDLARNLNERGHEARCLHLLGDIHSHPEALNIKKAEVHYQQALSMAKELGMSPLIAHSQKGLGALYAQSGREERALEELSTAANMYREMGMDFYLKQMESPS